MADEYLAMYLTVKFDLAGPTVFVPIRVFAETTLRLGQDIQNDAYFTTIDQAKDAMNRISLHSPFQVCVLLDSSLPARSVILKRKAAEANMTRMLHELSKFINAPKTAPTTGGKELSSMSLIFGMKSATTPYPDPFVASSNFEHDAWYIQVGMPQVLMQPAIIQDGFFIALTFHHPGNQVLLGKF
jgi:hypothetical protein